MKNYEPIYSPDAEWVNKNEVKLFVATPVHSDVTIHYMQSVFKLQSLCNQRKVPIMLQLMKSSLVTQGRNLCVSHFLNSDFTHLLFIDSDILFTPESIFSMIDKNEDVLSIPYPMKVIQWDKILNKWRDIPSMNHSQACTSGNMYPVRIKGDEKDIEVKNGMIELSHSMTGCMMIKREALQKMIDAYPDLTIKQKTMVDGKQVDKPNLYNFFDTYYDTDTKLYYGEDFAFSRLWTKIGGKCMALITEYITHIGEYQFSGRLIDEMVAQPTHSIDTSTKK
jgi:hypothetical protein|tara:strand:- start:182 stop:1018 length:837 start_codon:yes stop_codon:yes gene_type:complete